jgi:hypothetical protein
MGIQNLKHLSTGAVRLIFVDGTKVPCQLLENDPIHGWLHVETQPGAPAIYSYGDIAYATRCLNQPAYNPAA